jgi:AcrR family transcriptional regulator
MDKPRPAYHHGDLRAALIAAAEATLAESGVEGFSLRSVARRVGVSHSAPAHHFGDTQGLLSALSAEGFRRFRAAMLARQALAPADARSQTIASGLGYLDFAEASPTLFRLMFGSEKTRDHTPELADAGRAAFAVLVDDIARLRGVSPEHDPSAMLDVIGCWSLVHGFSMLLLAGRLKPVQALDKPARDATLAAIIAKALD